MTLIGIASGGILETSVLPYHIMRLRLSYENLHVELAVSDSAQRFATLTALQGMTGRPVYHRGSPFDPRTNAPFYMSFQIVSRLILYPATPRIIAQCATGVVEDPVTECFAFIPKHKVIVTPYLHPDLDAQLYEGHIDNLRNLGCTVVLPAQGLAWTSDSAWVKTEGALRDTLRLTRSTEVPTLFRASQGPTLL